MGGGAFCIKVCDPAGPNAAHFCEHIFDRIGCLYNAPNAAPNNVFQSCDGDNQDYPGVYTDASGAVQTFTQPPESLGPITSIPYTPRVPSSSNCVTYSANELYAAAASALPSSSGSAAPGVTGAPTLSAGKAGGATGSRSGSAATASQTGHTGGAVAIKASYVGVAGLLAGAALLL